MEKLDEALDLALWYLKTDVQRLFQVVTERLGLRNQPAEWHAWSAEQLARHWLGQLSLEQVARMWQQYRRERPAAKPLRVPMPKQPRRHATALVVPTLFALARKRA